MIKLFEEYDIFNVGDIVTVNQTYHGMDFLPTLFVVKVAQGVSCLLYFFNDQNEKHGWYNNDRIRLATDEEIYKTNLGLQTRKYNL